MKFRFPVVIIDEDFRSENISGSGIRALAEAIESEGAEVLGLTSYGDLTSFAQQSSRASCFILSIDDDELLPYADNVVVRRRHAGTRGGDRRAARVRHGRAPPQRRHPDLPVRRNAHLAPLAERHPARTARLHPHVRGHAGVRRAPHHPRGEGLSRFARAAVLQGTRAVRGRRLVLVALPGALGRRRVPEEPARADVPPVLRREHAARGRLQRRRRTRPVARSHRAGRGVRAQRGAHLQRGSSVLRDQRHVDVEQDRLARDRRAGRHRAGRPQLPQVDPARDHDDRRDPRVPHADAQSTSASSARFRATSSSRKTSARRSRRIRSRARRSRRIRRSSRAF